MPRDGRKKKKEGRTPCPRGFGRNSEPATGPGWTRTTPGHLPPCPAALLPPAHQKDALRILSPLRPPSSSYLFFFFIMVFSPSPINRAARLASDVFSNPSPAAFVPPSLTLFVRLRGAGPARRGRLRGLGGGSAPLPGGGWVMLGPDSLLSPGLPRLLHPPRGGGCAR